VAAGLWCQGVTGTVSATGIVARIWHYGIVRRYLVVLVLGMGILFAAIYANPGISTLGPTNVHQDDVGGVRPTLGEQPFRIEVLGQPVYESKKARNRRGGQPPPGAGGSSPVLLPSGPELLERDNPTVPNRGEP